LKTTDSDPARQAVIKKYGDRRLYDSTSRRYVNLEDIARMIREGVEVQVRDARTGKDLTRVVLTQIIMEDVRDDGTGLPTKLLRQMVVASDRATHEFLSWYLDTAFELYQKAGSALRSRVSDARSAVSSPVDFVRGLIGGILPRSAEQDAEIEELRRRVQELEAQAPPPRRRRPPRA
jgi:polyhydroxyalkanoate synthesis repressor PhaR